MLAPIGEPPGDGVRTARCQRDAGCDGGVPGISLAGILADSGAC
jgi:hypothetical protein